MWEGSNKHNTSFTLKPKLDNPNLVLELTRDLSHFYCSNMTAISYLGFRSSAFGSKLISKYVGQHSWWVFALCCVSVNVNTEYANTEESIINITQNYFHSNYLRLYSPRNSRYHRDLGAGGGYTGPAPLRHNSQPSGRSGLDGLKLKLTAGTKDQVN